MKTVNTSIYVLSIDTHGSVTILPVDVNHAENLKNLHAITEKEELQVYPDIQAAFVDFLQPVYKKICGK